MSRSPYADPETYAHAIQEIDIDAEGNVDVFGVRVDLQALTSAQRRTYQRMQLFCKAYAKAGDIQAARKVIGISRESVDKWLAYNHLGFRVMMQHAQADYADSLESKANELIQRLDVTNSPLLLIARLNAERPEKYKRNADGASENTAKDILKELRSISKNTSRRPERKRIIEGEVREVEEVTPTKVVATRREITFVDDDDDGVSGDVMEADQGDRGDTT